MPRKQNENLIPQNKRTKKEQREIAIKGGIASGEARRKKSAARDVAKMILSGNIPTTAPKNLVKKMGLPETELNVQAAIIAGQAMAAVKGNEKAARLVLELSQEIGENAIQGEEEAWPGLPARVLGSEWVDVNRSIDDREYSQYDFEAGRGSLKSSFCGLKLVDLIMSNKQFCGLAVRQLKDDLKDSVYSQIIWAIDELGLDDQFHATKSPMEIIRKSTGQKIYFRGADNPSKIKSIKPPKGMHIGIVWIEEADQLHGAAALRSILQSAFRGGDEGFLFRSYNTPISKQHFINVEARQNNPRRCLHRSHFKNAPPKWLGKRFHEEAEALKAINPRAYRHEYDGEATGTGANVFENVTLRAITDEEIRSFDRIYHGVDWGFYPDPWAYVKCSYNAAQRRLFIFDEASAFKLSNKETADILFKKGLTGDDELICDSAEPKSIGDYKEYGLLAIGAEKGPGSVHYSVKWLQGLTEIVIDNNLCPDTAEEFTTYEYERNKDGEIIAGYPDKDNHRIDGVRYGLNKLWRQRGV